MTDVPITYLPGAASMEVSGDFIQTELFNSMVPNPVTEDYPVGENTNFPIGTVVGISGGVLAKAKTSSTAIIPIGVLAAPVVTGSGVTTRAPVYMAGNFNPAALTWHADYDTDAKKAAAFRVSLPPTNIIIRARL